MSKQKHKRTKASQKDRMRMVLGRMLALFEEMDDDELDAWADTLDDMLERVAAEDGFGTEGQNDPRGDFRNGEWSMRRVEGLDK